MKSNWRNVLFLLLLTAAAFAVAGYHPGVEDAEIYVPGIIKTLNPASFPFGAEFFESHARLTLYPDLIADSVRLTHLSLGAVMLAWHLLTIFLVLLGCWRIASLCFESRAARWGGVALVAALFTIPVAGTALYIMDEYLNPRSIALFASLFAIAGVLKRKYLTPGLWIAFAAVIHPLMAVFGLSLIAVVILLRDIWGRWGPEDIEATAQASTAVASAAILLPLGVSFHEPSPAYRKIIQMRPYFFLLRWHWYEWLGIVAPFLLVWWFAQIARKHGMRTAELLCRALLIYQAVYFVLGLVMTVPPRLLALARYQPMRSLQIVYVLLFVLIGGFLAEAVLKNHAWRWLVLFVPLCAGMTYAQIQTFPASPHIEWPGAVPQNDWLRAFAWIRTNTPQDAIFALNPNHMALPGEDEHGFRALAERSMLADAVKDAGALTMFPDLPLAEHWEAQTAAQRGWEHFQLADFERLHRDWGVTWFLLDQPIGETPSTGLDCPYSNPTLRVCHLR